MKFETQWSQHYISRVRGKLACILLVGLVLIMSAGITIGFNPDNIGNVGIIFWTLFLTGFAGIVVGLACAKIFFNNIANTASARERLTEPGF